MKLLNLIDLEKRYGKAVALKVDSLSIDSGGTVGLVGNNGAGKTTMFKLVLDLIVPFEGHVELKGENVKGANEWKTFTGSYLDEGFLIGFLSPKEYLEFTATLHGLGTEDVTELMNYSDGFVTDELLSDTKLIRDLSQGNKARVGILGALLGKPELVLLDEPFAHIDPSTQIRLKNLVTKAKNDWGTTFVISSHDLKHVTETCDRIVLLEDGRVLKDIQISDDTLFELESYFSV